jgi:integrase
MATVQRHLISKVTQDDSQRCWVCLEPSRASASLKKANMPEFHPNPLPQAPSLPSVALALPLEDRARAYIRAAKSPATLRAYQTDWRHFEAWCRAGGRVALPATPETVALYLADHAPRHKPATLQRRLAAIAKVHSAAGLPSPASFQHAEVSETMKGIRRVHGIVQAVRRPLVTADMQQVLAHLPSGTLGARDRALLLTGYAGALRRGELAALTVGDLTWSEEGIAVRIRRSKTDQEGAGRSVALARGTHPHTCPVRALEAWMHAGGIAREEPRHNDHNDQNDQRDQPLFRPVGRGGRVGARALHANTVAKIVKRAVAAAGYDPAPFAGHSLRAGFATQAARNGVSAFDIMRQTGHRSLAMVARYVREATLFADTSAGKLGL